MTLAAIEFSTGAPEEGGLLSGEDLSRKVQAREGQGEQENCLSYLLIHQFGAGLLGFFNGDVCRRDTAIRMGCHAFTRA